MAKQSELLPSDPTQAALELAGAAEEDVPAGIWPRQLAELVDLMVVHFRRRGRTLDGALEESREIVLAMALYMGGHQLYLPNAAILKTALMHARIYHEHARGTNRKTLALDYGVSVRQIERIVARQVAFRRNRRQHSPIPDPGCD